MDIPHFIDHLSSQTPTELQRCAARLRAPETAADDVAWWHATLVVDHTLRRAGKARAAGLAASAAVAAVRDAAERGGARLADHEVTRVARSAAAVARALVAGVGGPYLTLLLRPWGLGSEVSDREPDGPARRQESVDTWGWATRASAGEPAVGSHVAVA